MRDDIGEIIEELIGHGVPRTVAPLLAAELIGIGAAAAVYRKETIATIADHLAYQRRERRT